MGFLVNGDNMFPGHGKAASGRTRGRKLLPAEVATEIFRLLEIQPALYYNIEYGIFSVVRIFNLSEKSLLRAKFLYETLE